ncbi:MAG: transcription factor S [Candidatus Nitrosocaldus sp.]
MITMRFCPKCGMRLVQGKGSDGTTRLTCRKCGYDEMVINPSTNTSKMKEEKPLIQVVGEEEGDISVMPTIKIPCPKCGHDTAVWWMLQTRSADEPTTQFYRCVKCNHTWRHYA